MNKSELATYIAARNGITQKAAGEMLNMVLDSFTENLVQDHKITLVGFGTILPVSRAARMGWNPKTKQKFPLPDRRDVVLKPGRVLLDKLNGRQG